MRASAIALAIAAVAAPAAAAPAAPTKDDALAALAAWTKAQNDGDLAAYGALYDAHFVGVKRTSDGGQKTYTLAAWQADRKKMFKARQKVAADGPIVTIKGARVSVTFVQRYQSGRYADHGDKALVLAPGKDGVLKIVREEMLYSAPGWDADPDAEVDASALAPPIAVKVRQVASDPSAVGVCDGAPCCGEVTYALELTDAKGKTIKRDVGGAMLPVEHATEVIAADPAAKGGPLFDVGESEGCGEVSLEYQISRNGDALVVRRDYVGETATQDVPWTTVLTVKLPAGAALR